FALAMYARLRVEGHAPAPADGHALSQLMAGLRFVRGDFVFAALICLALFNAVFGLSYVTLLPIFADVYFRAGSAGYGLLNAGHGLGALAGTLLVAAVAPRLARRGLIILAGAAGMGLGLVVFSRAPGLAVAVPVLACVGFSNTFYLTQVSTQLQQTVPDRLRGRVMSLYSLCWNLLPLVGLLGGVLAAAVDARFAVAMANVLTVVARIRAAKGKGDALAALLAEQAGVVRKAEPGCLAYRPHRSTKDPDLFIFYEQYNDDAAFDVHRKA